MSLSRAAQRDHGTALDHQDLAVSDRLRRKRVLLASLETENVARQMEAADLPTSVDQHLVGPHRPAHDLVEVVRRLVLPVDLAIARKRHQCTHQLDVVGRRLLARRRRVTKSCGRMLEGSGRGLRLRLRQHGS